MGDLLFDFDIWMHKSLRRRSACYCTTKLQHTKNASVVECLLREHHIIGFALSTPLQRLRFCGHSNSVGVLLYPFHYETDVVSFLMAFAPHRMAFAFHSSSHVGRYCAEHQECATKLQHTKDASACSRVSITLVHWCIGVLLYPFHYETNVFGHSPTSVDTVSYPSVSTSWISDDPPVTSSLLQ